MAITRQTEEPSSNSTQERSDTPPTWVPGNDVSIYIGLGAVDVTHREDQIGKPGRLDHKTRATIILMHKTHSSS